GRARLCTTAGEWWWSSYPAVMGKAASLPGLQVEETLALFGSTWGPARRAYERFVAEGTGGFDPLAQATGQVFLGDEDFVARVTRQATRPSREVPKQQRAWSTLAQLARQTPDRDAAIRAAYATG